MNSLVRSSIVTTQNAVFTDAAASTAGFDLGGLAGAMLLVEATSSGGAITLTFRVKRDSASASTFISANSSNLPVTLTVQPGRAYSLPDELFAAAYVMATTANAGETVTCTVVAKS